MMYVILRDGKVLQYNNAEVCGGDNGCINLYTKDSKFLVARIPIDVVERVEGERPCALLKAKSKRAITRKYER